MMHHAPGIIMHAAYLRSRRRKRRKTMCPSRTASFASDVAVRCAYPLAVHPAHLVREEGPESSGREKRDWHTCRKRAIGTGGRQCLLGSGLRNRTTPALLLQLSAQKLDLRDGRRDRQSRRRCGGELQGARSLAGLIRNRNRNTLIRNTMVRPLVRPECVPDILTLEPPGRVLLHSLTLVSRVVNDGVRTVLDDQTPREFPPMVESLFGQGIAA
mmetsp:Transcript_71863/g.206347  ORF Transcript_71863/g.206347 Transcript_71863/m.206347 type:complete len:214 (+) Transcript_71863:85-726(+)